MRFSAKIIDITPQPDKGHPMGGYGARNTPSEGTHDPLECRIFYFNFTNQSESNELFILNLDLIGLSRIVLDPYRKIFAKTLGVSWENIIINCTHTHSSWESLGVLGKGGLSPVYMRLNTHLIDELMRKILKEMKIAKKDAYEAKLGHSEIVLDNKYFVLRRRGEVPKKFRVNVVRITDLEERTTAILSVIGMHATILSHANLLFSKDWPGVFSTEFSRFYQINYGSQPIVGILMGAQGDVAPNIPRSLFEKYYKHKYVPASDDIQENPEYEIETLRKYVQGKKEFMSPFLFGQYLAKSILPFVHEIPVKKPKIFNHYVQNVYIPIFGIPESKSFKSIIRNIGDSSYKLLLFAIIRFVHRKAYAFSNIKKMKLNTCIGILRIDSFFLVETPGELFYEIAQKIKKNKKDSNIAVIGMTNDYASYIYPLHEFYKRGYENVFQIAPLTGEYILISSRRLLQKAITYGKNSKFLIEEPPFQRKIKFK